MISLTDVFCFDLETTSADPNTARVVQMAWQRGNLSGSFVCNPMEHISEGASAVHGYTDASVASYKPLREHACGIYTVMHGAFWLGYNAVRFDIPIIKREFTCAEIAVPECLGAIDPYKIFTHFHGSPRVRGARTLKAAHLHYCGCDFDGAHDASADIAATMRVWQAQMEAHSLTAEQCIEITQEASNTIDSRGMFKFATKEYIPTITFGKHAGKAMTDVPANYWSWIASADGFPDDVKAIAKNAVEGIFPTHK